MDADSSFAINCIYVFDRKTLLFALEHMVCSVVYSLLFVQLQNAGIAIELDVILHISPSSANNTRV